MKRFNSKPESGTRRGFFKGLFASLAMLTGLGAGIYRHPSGWVLKDEDF